MEYCARPTKAKVHTVLNFALKEAYALIPGRIQLWLTLNAETGTRRERGREGSIPRAPLRQINPFFFSWVTTNSLCRPHFRDKMEGIYLSRQGAGKENPAGHGIRGGNVSFSWHSSRSPTPHSNRRTNSNPKTDPAVIDTHVLVFASVYTSSTFSNVAQHLQRKPIISSPNSCRNGPNKGTVAIFLPAGRPW